ncbi:MAG TPA: AMP-binding protein, partial [Methanocorpusculum sp.]|nr:AMP-binding protein [Methanocorpusculum sp.]
ELTDACTCYLVDRAFSDTEPLPIGKPIDNVEIILLDDAGKPVPEGEQGEIGVQGICLSPGYYHDPEKTAQAFVESPVRKGARIYKTGDLARYNERGELMYLSRKDYQIKHLGRRIELGELETIADSLPAVARSCALYHHERHKIFLVVELESGTDTAVQDIMARLSAELPKYMVPNKILIIDKMPINSNGKIDRSALKEYLI